MSLTLTLERGGGEVSGSGTNIELDGTIAGGAIESVEMYGDTEQQTYSGKNLMTLTSKTSSGVTGTITDGSTITVSGTATVTTGVSVADLGKSIPAGTYTFTIDHAANHVINFTVTTSGGNVAFRLGVGETSTTQTLSSGSTAGQIFWAITNGQTYNETFKMQLVSGSTADYDFEPYVGGVASPNPDYPQEVQTVTGRQLVTISDGGNESQEYEINLGKNILDPYKKYSVGETITTNGITYTILDDGGIKVQGTATANANLDFIGTGWSDTTIQIPLDPSITYVSSITRPSNTYRWYLRGIVNGAVATLNSNNDEVIIQNCSGITYAMVQITPNNTVNGDVYCQVEKGSTATSFAPYFEPIELRKISDYQDYIYKSGEDWYLHKETRKVVLDGDEGWDMNSSYNNGFLVKSSDPSFQNTKYYGGFSNQYTIVDNSVTWQGAGKAGFNPSRVFWLQTINTTYTLQTFKDSISTNPIIVYCVESTPTDTQITSSALISQLEALNSAQTYDGETVITVGSENLAGTLEVKAATNIKKTYTEVEIGSPFTISDVEGKSSNTTLDGNVYVDWAYNKKQYSFDLFNLTPQDYADIRAFYDYQFSSSAFPTITVPELNIDKLPVYMEISSRNIINQCLLTDKLTIKFRETVQP